MRIFSDFHHSGLYASFVHLFDRLGHELYRPIGMDWFDKGYWNIGDPYADPRNTALQYLRAGHIPSDGTRPLNKLGEDEEITGNSPSSDWDHIFRIEDTNNHVWHRAVEFDKFLELNVDVIIASIPAHITSYKRLIKEHNLKAKLVYHIGNIGWHNDIPWSEVDNIMASVKEFPIKHDVNTVFYRQEFDLDIFGVNEGFDLGTYRIISFVNCLPQIDKYFQLKDLLPAFNFKAFGITPSPDGNINDIYTIADLMKDAVFGYHNKPHGDGYGHIIHNWMAVGKPVIVNLNDYEDKLAGELLEDGVTCIDMSRRSLGEVAGIVNNIMTSGQYEQMCENVKERFSKVVDFKKDAEKVKEFLNALR